MPERKAHFIGIAGMGMSATAILLKEQGWGVSGSDTDVYPPATDQLARHEVSFVTTYNPINIPKNVDVIIVGKNAKLTREDNAEVRAAYESGVRIASFPEVLGEILENREVTVVAGSYGKSTTTALMAWCLFRSGVDAGWFIGAAPEGLEPAHLGSHKAFVIEGDEYPTSHDDPRPKFAHYRARDALITAASHDHVNIYKTQKDFLQSFETLVAGLPAEGVLLLCRDESNVMLLERKTKARVVSYGFNSGDWHAENIRRGETTTFDLRLREERIVTLSTKLLGDHNIQNIVGASAMMLEKKLLSPEQIAKTIRDFKGLARRLDKKTATSRVPAYEAFGSSREKLRAAIAAIRERHHNKRLVVVFEPHTFSWRNKNMLHWFDDAFEGADMVFLYKPAEQGAATHEQSAQEEMTARLSAAGIDARPVRTASETMSALKKEIRAGDVVLLSSSGPMDSLIESIPKWLDNTFA